MDQSDDPIQQLINETKELLAQGHRAAREAQELLDQMDVAQVVVLRLMPPLNALLHEVSIEELEVAAAQACRVLSRHTTFH